MAFCKRLDEFRVKFLLVIDEAPESHQSESETYSFGSSPHFPVIREANFDESFIDVSSIFNHYLM